MVLQVQFHGVALLHALRAGDRLAISKLVTSLTQKNVRSSLAQVLLVRCGFIWKACCLLCAHCVYPEIVLLGAHAYKTKAASLQSTEWA